MSDSMTKDKTMKAAVAGLLACGSIGAGMLASAPQAQAAPVRGSVQSTTAVNVRSGASVQSTRLGTVAKGTRLATTGVTRQGWRQVTYQGRTAWISSRYVVSVRTVSAPVRVASAPVVRVSSSASSSTATKAVAFAMSQRGKPYRYGATGPSSYDCSGLTQAAYRAAGVRIGRTTYDQLGSLKRVSRSELRYGDIVGFYGGGHVGIYIGNEQVVHAPRTGAVVRVESMKNMPFYSAVRAA